MAGVHTVIIRSMLRARSRLCVVAAEILCSLSCVRLQCDFRGGQTLFDVAWEFPVACLLTVCLCGCGVESGDRSLSLGAPSTSTHNPATYLSSVFGRI